jgi:hypothetical protein
MKKIMVIIVGLMFATSISYIVDVSADFFEQDPDDLGEETLFIIAVIAYILVAFWMTRTKSLVPVIIAIIGSIGLIILYVFAVTDLSESVLQMDTEKVSVLGIISKVLQIAVIVALVIRIKLKGSVTSQVDY